MTLCNVCYTSSRYYTDINFRLLLALYRSSKYFYCFSNYTIFSKYKFFTLVDTKVRYQRIPKCKMI